MLLLFSTSLLGSALLFFLACELDSHLWNPRSHLIMGDIWFSRKLFKSYALFSCFKWLYFYSSFFLDMTTSPSSCSTQPSFTFCWLLITYSILLTFCSWGFNLMISLFKSYTLSSHICKSFFWYLHAAIILLTLANSFSTTSMVDSYTCLRSLISISYSLVSTTWLSS